MAIQSASRFRLFLKARLGQTLQPQGTQNGELLALVRRNSRLIRFEAHLSGRCPQNYGPQIVAALLHKHTRQTGKYGGFHLATAHVRVEGVGPDLMNKRKIIGLASVAVAALLAWLGWRAWLAHEELVTLDVRNMDVREVVRKIEWQVWDVIYVDKAVEGKVTLNVKRMPLEQVLGLVAGQTSARSSVLYPIYSSGKSFTAFKKSLRGEADPATSGWTNLVANPFGGFGGPGGFGMMGPGGGGFPGQMPAGDGRVSLTIQGKDIDFAAMAFNRFAQARVVPEDGVAENINVVIDKAPVAKAVAQLAKAAKRDWAKTYALQAGFGFGGPRGPGGPGGPPQFTGGGDGGPGRFGLRGSNGPPQFAFGGQGMSEEAREESRKKREKLEEELKQTLPTEERQKLDQAQQERQKLMEEMANLSPEERRARFQQMMGGQNIDRMMRDRLMNSTPEQRAQMDQRMRQMRGPGGGPGGPGGPPR